MTEAPVSSQVVETIRRWCRQGCTDDSETPVDDYGKRLLRQLESTIPLDAPSSSSGSERQHYWRAAVDLVADTLVTLKPEELEARAPKLVAILRNASSGSDGGETAPPTDAAIIKAAYERTHRSISCSGPSGALVRCHERERGARVPAADWCNYCLLRWLADRAFAAAPPVGASGSDPFERIKALPQGWDGYKAPPLDHAAVERGRTWLNAVNVVPCQSGGVQLEWHCKEFDFEVEFYPDGTCDALFTDRQSSSGSEAGETAREDLIGSLHDVFTQHGIASRADLPHGLIADIASWAARKCREAQPTALTDDVLRRLWRSVRGPAAELSGPVIRFAACVLAEARQPVAAPPVGAHSVGDHYGAGWVAGRSSVSTCRKCGQFLNHGHECPIHSSPAGGEQ